MDEDHGKNIDGNGYGNGEGNLKRALEIDGGGDVKRRKIDGNGRSSGGFDDCNDGNGDDNCKRLKELEVDVEFSEGDVKRRKNDGNGGSNGNDGDFEIAAGVSDGDVKKRRGDGNGGSNGGCDDCNGDNDGNGEDNCKRLKDLEVDVDVSEGDAKKQRDDDNGGSNGGCDCDFVTVDVSGGDVKKRRNEDTGGSDGNCDNRNDSNGGKSEDNCQRLPDLEVDVEGGDGEEKMRRTDGDGGGGGGGDEDMKRVAEIVLVLNGMVKMRGGGEPTVVEKELMAEAKAKVTAMCEEFAPKELFPLEGFGGIIHDLGLNRIRDRVGFHTGPKQSISEKIAFSKRRMEESKAFASQPASSSSQRVQAASGAANENRMAPPTVRAFSNDKPSHVPSDTGTFRPPVLNVSSAASTPTQFRPPRLEARPPVSLVLKNTVGKDANTGVSTRHGRAHIRPDGRLNGPSANVPASSGLHQPTMRTTRAHVQHQSLQQVNVGTKGTASDQSSVRISSNIGSTAPNKVSQSVDQMLGPAVKRTAFGSQSTVHHPVQNMQYRHAPQSVNHHSRISNKVNRQIAPKLPPRPVSTLPSRDYISRAIVCYFCKLAINVTENMVVCDACEKGFHLGCLQSYNAKGLPRGEWYCPRCLSMSHGKPFGPKYGRVTRNMNAPKTTGVQSSLEKKVGTVTKVSLPNATVNRNHDSKTHQLNQPNATNRSHDLKSQTQAVKVIQASSESNLRQGNDIAGNATSTGAGDVKPKLENCTNDTTGAEIKAFLSTFTTPAIDKPSQQVKPDIPSSEGRLMSKTESRPPVISQADSKPDSLPTSSNQNDLDRKVLNSAKQSVLKHSDSNGVAESHLGNDCEKQAVKKNYAEIERVHDQAKDLFESLDSGLHNVDWVGEVDQILDEKKFFRSCRVNGMLYRVQEYALYRSGNGKLIPLKLQAMWEDSKTSSKWLAVRKCYFPDDLPKEVGRPGVPERNEVYESTHDSNVLAGIVQGPCKVLPFRKFGEETETSDQEAQAKEGSQPVFIRNWFYDEPIRAFCPSAS